MNALLEAQPPERDLLSSGLDYYKPTMSQLQYEQLEGVEVTFTFKNRGDQRFEHYVEAHDIDLEAIYEEGERRLSEKIAILQANPDIKFSDFGTRRHFSLRWQKHVVERLRAECPENFVGTSNVGLAHGLGIKP